MSVASPSDPLDVLIVGAGLSGIGAAVHLQKGCPGKRFAIVEARQAIGGTWDLFRYPGIRSDSDMYTLGYAFKPWLAAKAIADGPSIREYIRETAREYGIDRHIRFGHKVVAANWSSEDACWSVEVELVHSGERQTIRTRFLSMCSGYYDYEQPHRPTLEGEREFTGRIVHPQFWPEDLDYSGKRIVVVGSGATAVTLVPAMAADAAHVTMLQRSPGYVVAWPSEFAFAKRWRRLLPEKLAYAVTRLQIVAQGMLLYHISRSRPEDTKRRIVAMAARRLGAGFDVATHFTPSYKPWDQRICVAPDGDLFRAIRKGHASVVTDTIERFTATGIKLASGRELEADIVVMATGLQVKILGGAAVSVDGQPYDVSQSLSYKGMMLSDLPNCFMTFGFVNASWTLKADLTASYVCRLLRYMDRHGHAIAVARCQPDVETQPFINFTSGYVQRAAQRLPRQGTRKPWRLHQNYFKDLATIRFGRIADGVLRFGAKGAPP